MSTRDDYITHDFVDDGPARELLDQLRARREESIAAARAEERARIVALLRREASALLRHDAQAVVLGLADRIERGEV